MKIARIAAAALLVSCTSAPLQQPPQPVKIEGALPGSAHQHSHDPVPASISSLDKERPDDKHLPYNLPPRQDLINGAEGSIRTGSSGDSLAIKVMIKRPATAYKAQQLETERIHNLRAWVKGPGISDAQPIYNIDKAFVPVANQDEATSLRILEVPPGQFRIVTVQGYAPQDQGYAQESREEGYPVIQGATLKAVYHSRPDTNEHQLIFSWRSTLEAEIYEKLLELMVNNSGIQFVLEQLDPEALGEFLDKLVYGASPPQSTEYITHPAQISPTLIAGALVNTGGEIPSSTNPNNWLKPLATATISLRDPQLTAFQHSTIELRFSDPASQPLCISIDGSDVPPCIQSTGNVPLPGLVTGQWFATATIDGPNGGVSTRVTVTVDANGNATLSKIDETGSTPLSAIVLPPIIESLSASAAGAGDQIYIYGDGFDSTTNNIKVFFTDPDTGTVYPAPPVFSTRENRIGAQVPDDLPPGNYRLTVTSNGIESNYIDFANRPAIVSVSQAGGPVGSGVSITITGFDATQYGGPGEPALNVSFNGVPVPAADIQILDHNLILVKVPVGATTGEITVTPEGLGVLEGPEFVVEELVATEVFNANTGNPITSAGVGSYIAVGFVNGDDIDQICFGSYCLPITTPGITKVIKEDGTGEIRVTVPPQAESGSITLKTGTTTPGDTSDDQSATLPFTLQLPPTITSTVPPNINDPTPSITLTGTNFSTTSQVTIGGVTVPPENYTIVSNTQIVINQLPDPTNPVQGVITVTNPAGTATTSLTYSNVINFLGDASDPAVGGSENPINDVKYLCPHGVNVDRDGNIYVINISCTGDLYDDGVYSATYRLHSRISPYGSNIHKYSPTGQLIWASGSNVPSIKESYLYAGGSYYCHPDGATCPKISDGPALGRSGYVDGNLADALFADPEDAANDNNGNLYVADTGNDAIRKITPEGQVYTLARLPGPEGIEITTDGKLYVTGNYPDNPGSINPLVNTAYVLRIDDLGTIPSSIGASFTSYNPNHATESQRWTSNVTKVAGGLATNTPATGPVSPALNARFSHLEGLGIDGQNRVYVADVENRQIRRIEPDPNNPGQNRVVVYANVNGGTTTSNPSIYMHEIRVDRAGNVFVPSPDAQPATGIYLMQPNGSSVKISLVAGKVGSSGQIDGHPITRATFGSARGIDFGPQGELYVADPNWGIRKIERYVPAPGLQMP